jgi:hypothetical protein
VTNEIYAPVNRMQSLTRDAACDRAAPESKREKLASRHHAVLPFRQRRKLPIACAHPSVVE